MLRSPVGKLWGEFMRIKRSIVGLAAVLVLVAGGGPAFAGVHTGGGATCGYHAYSVVTHLSTTLLTPTAHFHTQRKKGSSSESQLMVGQWRKSWKSFGFSEILYWEVEGNGPSTGSMYCGYTQTNQK
jgi:hypothetical protein